MSVRQLGSYNTATTRTRVRFIFTTHSSTGANIAPLSAFEAADLRIYRAADGGAYSATQRSSASGITMTSPFDSLTGVHAVDIDLSDNTDAGFYAAGYSYAVVLSPDSETIDGETITGSILAEFEIGPPPVNVTQAAGTAWGSGAITRAAFAADTGLQSVRSNTAQAGAATTITLDASASAVDDFYNGAYVTITGGTGVGQTRAITDYVGSTKVATVGTWATNPDNTSTFAVLRVEAGVAAIFSEVIENSVTFRNLLKRYNAVMMGEINGAGTTTVNLRNLADTLNRIVATVDASGNRSALTFNDG